MKSKRTVFCVENHFVGNENYYVNNESFMHRRVSTLYVLRITSSFFSFIHNSVVDEKNV